MSDGFISERNLCFANGYYLLGKVRELSGLKGKQHKNEASAQSFVHRAEVPQSGANKTCGLNVEFSVGYCRELMVCKSSSGLGLPVGEWLFKLLCFSSNCMIVLRSLEEVERVASSNQDAVSL